MLSDLSDYRHLFVGIEEEVPIRGGGKVRAVNFDNAATTPPFKSVLEGIKEMSSWYSSIHRGKGYKSKICDELFEKARNRILSFVNASGDKYNVIFVKNTTEGINKLAYRLINCQEGIVISTRMEHHSNDLPWRDKCKVVYVEVDRDGRLSIEDLIRKLNENVGRVKLVTLTGASNVTGYVNDVNLIACLCHSYGTRLLVDGAQLVPHRRVALSGTGNDDHIDYLVFSAHKLYAPFGIGIIAVPKDCFQCGAPDYKGGGTVKFVTDDSVVWDIPPHKEEAGTPNLMGIVALLSAIKELSLIGMDKVKDHEKKLTSYLMRGLRSINGIELYGDCYNLKDRQGIITFNIKGMHHEQAAELLSEDYGIAVRNGCFCAQPYVQRLLRLTDKEIMEYITQRDKPKPGMVRVSLGLYNTKEEVDYLLNSLESIIVKKEKSLYYY